MADKIRLREVTDWTPLDGEDSFWEGMDLGAEDNFGIHMHDGELCTGGMAGVGRLYDRKRRPLRSDGRDHVLVVRPRYGVDPWVMLEKVMADEEYEDYVRESEARHKSLYRVFYDRPLIRLERDEEDGGDLLCALSFIHACYKLCQKGVRKTLFYREENCNAKIRGRVDVRNNIRLNAAYGRNDRFYCKYIDFSEDNVENRILKGALLRCRRIIDRRFETGAEIARRVRFCLHTLRNVRTVRITGGDFGHMSAGGLYTYYKPLLQQAKCILRKRYYSYRAADGRTADRSVYTIPYWINMETVFEFYARTMLKTMLPEDCVMDPYTQKIYTESGVTDDRDALSRVHLISYCIPDIIIRDRRTGQVVAVCDVKYKDHARPDRGDSHQLLSYALLTGADRCGFIFPGEGTGLKELRASEYLDIGAQDRKLQYFELLLGTGDE